MNTCRMIIARYPDGEQCGDVMGEFHIDIQPINLNLPDWVRHTITRHMCAHPDHAELHNLPDLTPTLDAMCRHKLDTAVLVSPDLGRIYSYLRSGATAAFADDIDHHRSVLHRPKGWDTVIYDDELGEMTTAIRKGSWGAGEGR